MAPVSFFFVGWKRERERNVRFIEAAVAIEEKSRKPIL